MKKVVIFGIGKISDVVFFNFKKDPDLEVVAFTVDREFITSEEKFSLPVIPFDQVTSSYPPEQFAMFVAIGYQEMNKLREEKYKAAKEYGYELVSYISPDSDFCIGTEIGENSLVLGNTAIEPCTKIGNNTFIWSNSVLGHHSELKDHCFVSGGVNIGGTAVIENNCFIGLNSIVGHEITVGRESFIGAGAVVLKNAEAKSVFISPGTPKFRLDSAAFLKISKLK